MAFQAKPTPGLIKTGSSKKTSTKSAKKNKSLSSFSLEKNSLLAEIESKSLLNKSLVDKLHVFETEEAKMARRINEQTLAMQEQAQAILDALNDEGDSPAVVVDGISSGYAGAKPAEKLYQDQTAVQIDVDTIDDLDDLSISVLRPEIILKHEGTYKTKNSNSGIGSGRYLDLYTGNVLRELLHNDAATFSLSQLQSAAPELIDTAAERVENIHEQTNEEVESLVVYRTMINQSVASLDLHQCSEEIGALMLDSVSSSLQPEDGSIEDLPSSLVELVRVSDNVKSEIEKSYSNTKLYYSLLSTIYESITGYASHLGDDGRQTKKPMSYESSSRNRYSLKKLRENQKSQTQVGIKTVIRQGFTAILPEIENSSVTNDLQKFLACLSNELLLSCGISRLAGTELGNKYGVTSDNPLDVVIGSNMGQMYQKGGVVIPEAVAKKGSLLDFITAEDTDSDRIVLPFEVNDITLAKQKYLPGSDYLVEGPARKLDISFNDPIGKFSNNFAGEVKSSKNYLEELMSLSESTLLSPQGILIRVLEDIYTICLEGSKPIDFIDRNAMMSALKISVATGKKQQKMNGTNVPPWHRMCSTDTNAIIQNVRAQETQPSYRLAVDPAVISEIENTDTFYKSRTHFNHAFNNYWRWYIGELKSDKTSTSVIPLGDYRKVRISIDSDEGETQSVHKMIIDLADELMSEVENFTSRGGINASYKNNEGNTVASNLDYSAIVAMIQQIYHTLLSNLFHWTPITRGSSGDYKRAVRLETQKNKVTADSILAVLNTYKEGSRFDDLFDEGGNALALEGVSSSTKIGKNITLGQLTDTIDSMRNHRSYMKCCISALEAISTNIAQKSQPLSKFQKSAREVITNKKRLENVKNKKLAAFCRLVKLPVGSDALRGLTSMQCSNTILSRERLTPTPGIEMRHKRAVLSPGLLDALKVFHETPLFKGTQNIMCVGLPNGMMDKLKTSSVGTHKREAVSETSSEFSLVFTSDNELFSSLSFEDYVAEFDASIYLFPDSYDNYVPPDPEAGAGLLSTPDPLRDLINKTIFHRIISGVTVESEVGSVLIDQGDDKTYEVLKNHVYSDLVRISTEITLSMGVSEADIKKYTELNVSSYSSEGFKLLQSMQKNKSVNMMTAGIEKVFDPVLIDEKNVFYKFGTNSQARRSYNMLTGNDQNDIVRLSASSMFTAELDRHKILSTSIFDRVLYVQVNHDDFALDKSEGLKVETQRYLGQTVPNQGSDTFDLTGVYCEVRAK